MYSNYYFNGNNLPAKTLSLSFDDGPGEPYVDGKGANTIELAKYLASEGIRATFFVVGKNAIRYPDSLKILKDLGHLIGNHTFDHPKLTDLVKVDGDIVDQIIRTDAAIKHWVDSKTIFFRPPYGAWSTEICDILNKNLLASLNHVGPVKWDIDGRDWESWQKGYSVDYTLANYLNLIQKKNHGIVLNHDCSSDSESSKRDNMTLPLMLKLIPKLKALEYNFVRLDEINDIRMACHSPLNLALRSSNGKFLSLQNYGDFKAATAGSTIGKFEKLTIIGNDEGKVAIQASNGLYVSPLEGGGAEVLANSSTVCSWEKFDLIHLKNEKIAFRTITGNYLTIEKNSGERLMANAQQLGESEVFTSYLL